MDQPLMLHAIAESAPALVAGALAGAVFKRYLFSRLLVRLGPWASRSPQRATSLFLIVASAGLAVFFHPANATEALAWLQAHPALVPGQPTRVWLQVISHGAAFFAAYQLAALVVAPSAAPSR